MVLWEIPTRLGEDELEKFVRRELVPGFPRCSFGVRGNVLQVEPDGLNFEEIEELAKAVAPFVPPGEHVELLLPDERGFPGGCVIKGGKVLRAISRLVLLE